MSTLVFGGSFNPIHHGHLICVRAMAEAKGFDRIVLIPSAYPPHKPAGAAIAPPTDRLAMCRLAVQGSNLFEVNDLELRRPGLSYTIDTVRQLTSEGFGKVNWLVGADTVPHLPTWHRADELMAAAEFWVVGRPGASIEWDKLAPIYEALRRNVVETPLVDISATDIRRRAKDGRPIDYLTPPAVVRYIAEHGLYGAGSPRS